MLNPDRLAPLRNALIHHRLYERLNRLDALHRFMESHVFAVWDFMSLLKRLQQQLCCVEVPWLSPADPQLCRFLNEIVLAEESDDDGHGGYGSHFDLYYRSMKQSGASTAGIDAFIADLRRGAGVEQALAAPLVPDPARRFVRHTFEVLGQTRLPAVASAFTYGREDLLPAVFQKIVDRLNTESGGCLEDFRYYLQRHIGLDGDEHGPMATRLVASVCGDDPQSWKDAEAAAVSSLEARLELWNAIAESV